MWKRYSDSNLSWDQIVDPEAVATLSTAAAIQSLSKSNVCIEWVCWEPSIQSLSQEHWAWGRNIPWMGQQIITWHHVSQIHGKYIYHFEEPLNNFNTSHPSVSPHFYPIKIKHQPKERPVEKGKKWRQIWKAKRGRSRKPQKIERERKSETREREREKEVLRSCLPSSFLNHVYKLFPINC